MSYQERMPAHAQTSGIFLEEGGTEVRVKGTSLWCLSSVTSFYGKLKILLKNPNSLIFIHAARKPVWLNPNTYERSNQRQMYCCLLPFLALEERQTILGQKKEAKQAFYYIRKSANTKKITTGRPRSILGTPMDTFPLCTPIGIFLGRAGKAEHRSFMQACESTQSAQ